MGYSLLAPGKRLRPLLAVLACEACGGRDRDALPAGAAVEMVHTYSLIHDDLPAMDDDDLRRGRPTCHKQFGEALAILAGDALLTMAFQVLAEQLPAKTAASCTLELARATGAAGMVGGQAEDLAWERSSAQQPDPRKFFPRTEQPHTLAALEHIHRLKTGALFQVCLRLGVLSALGEKLDKRSEPLLQALDAYGQRFGLVFQITDDLLDVEGTVAAMGKQVNKDSARGKLTYPSFLGVAESRARGESLRQEAIVALADLGSRAEPLAALMNYVVERKR